MKKLYISPGHVILRAGGVQKSKQVIARKRLSSSAGEVKDAMGKIRRSSGAYFGEKVMDS